MDLGIAGKVAFVAAASKGLGRAIAQELAREGAGLAISARGADALGRTATDIARETGREVLAIPGDVSHPEAAQEMIDAAIVALLLAFVPYLLIRGPVARLARWWFGRAAATSAHARRQP